MSASDAIIADADERARALDPTRSFIVQAPAGSGKTSLLVARYLRLLEAARRPEEVLAITFTRKAAAEMRRRVLEALPDSADLAHRLRIETIDAFCLALVRQLPVPAKFGVPPGIAEDARPLYREAAQRALADFARPAVARLLAHLDGHVGLAADLLAAMLARRDQWLRHAGRTPTREDLEAALARERERLLAQARALDARASVEFAREVLTAKGEWRKRAPAALAAAGNEPSRAALAALLALPPERYSDAQWEALEALLAVLRLAVAELKLVFAEAGACDFTEIAQGAVRALGTPDAPTDLLLALDYRIHHVLVDEFQDTSLSQRELLVCLTAGWSPGDGRTLFLVGDPMQSIYRFRDADVGIFLRTWREGLPNVALERIRLKTNFRSQPGLVAWVNETFRRVLPEREDEASGAVPFSEAAPHPANEALPGPAVQWHAPADEAEQAALVVQLVRAAEGDCALLVRNRSALAEIVPALKRAGVRFRAIEIEHLGEKQVVQDLCALARALAHPADRVAWLALARAPWCGHDARAAQPRARRPKRHRLGAACRGAGGGAPSRGACAGARSARAREPAQPRRGRLARPRRPGVRRRPDGARGRRDLFRCARAARARRRGGLRAPFGADRKALRRARHRRRRARPAGDDHPQGERARVRHRHRAGAAPRAGRGRAAAHALARARRRRAPACADQADRRRRRSALRVPEKARARGRAARGGTPALCRGDARASTPSPARLSAEGDAAATQPARLRVGGGEAVLRGPCAAGARDAAGRATGRAVRAEAVAAAVAAA
ncbi:MAG: UvrD-helicase domain-containing protein [Burkholderiales bacterium]|nr:UvrD-helicase domain-containing protein [Burkholderiales bacterium]